MIHMFNLRLSSLLITVSACRHLRVDQPFWSTVIRRTVYTVAPPIYATAIVRVLIATKVNSFCNYMYTHHLMRLRAPGLADCMRSTART